MAHTSDTLPGSWLLSARAHYGFIMAHRPTIVHLQQKHVRGFEIELAKPLKGDEEWQQPYQLPLFSIAYQYFDLGNQEELGNGHTIFPRIIFPLNKNHWLRSSLSAGVGIGYIEKIFHRYDNYKNTAIGSHLNAVVNFSYDFRIKVSASTQANAGISFTHFSNGATRPPNLGINIPTLHAGFSWYLGRPLPRTFAPASPVKKEIFHKLGIGAGIKGVETDQGIEKYGVTVFSYSLNKIISHKSRLSLGLDGFYDGTLPYKLENLNKEPVSASVAYRIGINAGYELSAGRISMLLKNGVYLVDQYKEDGAYYIIVGVEYKFTKHLFAAYYLKTHYGKADFFEYAIGYILH